MPGEVSRKTKLRPLVGASILSSVGSLPLHLVPLIVVTLIADSRASVKGAGWVASAILFGQLSTALALPMLKIFNVTRNLIISAALLLVTGLVISSIPEYLVTMAGWFLIGQCCGILSCLGTIAASQFPRPAFAFSLRLAISLIFGGCVSSALQLTGMLVSYRDLLTVVVLAVILMLTFGVMLHQPVEGGARNSNKASRFEFRSSAGLLTVYFFFVGQTGFLAYVVQQAIGRGMHFGSIALSLALMKLAAGVWIIFFAHSEAEGPKITRFGALSFILIAAVVALAYTREMAVFFLALLAKELALNKLSARLQSAVVALRPEFAGRWLTGVMLLGAASGPPLNGLMISIGLGDAFVAVCVLSALGPLLWQRWSASRARMVKTPREDVATASAQ
jgi:hypothetical protein